MNLGDDPCRRYTKQVYVALRMLDLTDNVTRRAKKMTLFIIHDQTGVPSYFFEKSQSHKAPMLV